MDGQDIRTLQVLEEFERNGETSQRALAEKLDISLGLANSFIKLLARKGYFKITNLPANRVRYILTPKGAAEKVKLTYDFVQYSFHFYKRSRIKIQKLMADIENQGDSRLLFWGTGEVAEIAYLSLQGFALDLVAVIDNTKKGGSFFGKIIIGEDDLTDYEFDKILITSIDREGEDLKKFTSMNRIKGKVVFID